MQGAGKDLLVAAHLRTRSLKDSPTGLTRQPTHAPDDFVTHHMHLPRLNHQRNATSPGAAATAAAGAAGQLADSATPTLAADPNGGLRGMPGHGRFSSMSSFDAASWMPQLQPPPGQSGGDSAAAGGAAAAAAVMDDGRGGGGSGGGGAAGEAAGAAAGGQRGEVLQGTLLGPAAVGGGGGGVVAAAGLDQMRLVYVQVRVRGISALVGTPRRGRSPATGRIRCLTAHTVAGVTTFRVSARRLACARAACAWLPHSLASRRGCSRRVAFAFRPRWRSAFKRLLQPRKTAIRGCVAPGVRGAQIKGARGLIKPTVQGVAIEYATYCVINLGGVRRRTQVRVWHHWDRGLGRERGAGVRRAVLARKPWRPQGRVRRVFWDASTAQRFRPPHL